MSVDDGEKVLVLMMAINTASPASNLVRRYSQGGNGQNRLIEQLSGEMPLARRRIFSHKTISR
jgi:hypothetical protein